MEFRNSGLKVVYGVVLSLFILWPTTEPSAKERELKPPLNTEQEALFQRIAEEQFCPCGKPQSFLETMNAAQDCPEALNLGRFLRAEITKGGSRRSIVKAFLRRMATINARVSIATDAKTPHMGSPKAPVRVVIYSDFECPFCGRIGDPLKAIVKADPAVTLYYKYYPLPMHKNAEKAAHAACAAHEGGKFWEMHDALFESRADLSAETYRSLAKKLKLNLKKFEKNRLSVSCIEKVEQDRKEGDAIDIQGTPSIYVNGLLVDSVQDVPKAIEDAKQFELTP